MSLNANDKRYEGENKRVEQPVLEVGAYPIRLVQVIGLGLQPQEYYGEAKPPKDEIRAVYEMLDEFCIDEDGKELDDKPRWMGEDFTMNSLQVDRAKSTARYYALDPKEEMGGDWDKLLGRCATMTVVQKEGTKGKNKGRIFNNVGSLSPMREKEAANAPELINPTLVFDFYNPDLEVFLSLPNFVQNKIKGALNFDGSKLESLIDGHEGGSEGGTKAEASKGSEKSSQEVSGTKETDTDDEDW